MEGIVAGSGLVFGVGFFSGFIWRQERFFSIVLSIMLIFISLFLISQAHHETLLVTGLVVGFLLGRFKGLATGTVHFLGGVFSFIDRLAPERNKLTPEEEEILRQWHAFKKDAEYNRQAEAKRQQREQEERAWRAREEAKQGDSEQSQKQEYRREYREERSKSEERDWQKEQEQAQERRRQAQEKAKAKRVQGYLDILGLSGAFTEASLKKAYRKKRSEYHPDKHPNASEAEKRQFAELFNLVQEAYDYLKQL